MKKSLAFLIALVLMFSSVSAFAEEFSIRKGITFGMTVEEVNAVEGVTLHYDDDGIEGTIDGYDTYFANGELAGYSCSFYYLFDQTDNKLSSIVYSLYEWCDSKQEHSDFYSEQIADLDTILTEKYETVSLGSFDELKSSVCHAIIADADDNSALFDVKVDGKQYLVRYDDCYFNFEVSS